MGKKPVEIIAELGINHDGKLEKAIQMIEVAKLAGADTVKFQLVDPNFYAQGSELHEIFKRTFLSVDDHKVLYSTARKLGLDYLCTPSDVQMAIALNEQVQVGRFKIASDSAEDTELIEYIKKTGKPVLISTGHLRTPEKLDQLREKTMDWANRIVVLHCVSKYPCPIDKVEMVESMLSLNTRFEHIGYSDHTQGIEAAPLAVACGAEVIEKHFMIDLDCVDAPVSLMPGDFWQMVKSVRNAEKML